MQLNYDNYSRTESKRIFLAKPGKRIIGELNGIDQQSASCNVNLNNTSTLSFDVWRDVDGEISNYYDQITQHFELYLEGIGWFKIHEEPVLNNDGKTETTSVSAESLEIELQQYDLVGFKVNAGTEDSWETMAVDNQFDYDGYKLPIDSVQFWRDTTVYEKAVEEYAKGTNPQDIVKSFPQILSSPRIRVETDPEVTDIKATLRTVIAEYKKAGVDTSDLEDFLDADEIFSDDIKPYLDIFPLLRQYVTYTFDLVAEDENGDEIRLTVKDIFDRELQRQRELSLLWLVTNEHGWKVGWVDPTISADHPIPLGQEIGKFEVDSQNTYAFLTQEVASYFQCLFVFDTMDYTVNAVRIESLGKDTNIFLSFHNIQNSITRSGDRELYTVYHVSNDDTINVREANLGSDTVEDISYFLNTDNFTQEFINKYNRWAAVREQNRQEYMKLSVKYRDQQDVVSDIQYRVPNDISDPEQLKTLSDEELVEYKSDIEATIRGYEIFYQDEAGNFDIEALKKNREDYQAYIMYKDIALKNVEIEMANRALPNKQNLADYVDDYLYDFEKFGDSYGLEELKIQLQSLQDKKNRLEENGYDKPSDPVDEYHDTQYALYLKYSKAYDQCKEVLDQRQAEYDAEDRILKNIQKQRLDLVDASKIENAEFGMTEYELWLLDKYYIHTDYINPNIITTSLSSNQEIVDKSDELYQDALEYLYADSHPQWVFNTTQDNLLAMPELKDWHGDLEVGNYLRVSIRDDYQVKLRLTGITFNPFMIDTNIDLQFSNFVQYKSKRNDFVSILSGYSGSGKNQITVGATSANQGDVTYNVDAGLIKKIINSGSFSNYVGNIVSDSIGTAGGPVINSIVTNKLSSAQISVDQIKGEQGQFNQFFSNYLESGTIVTGLLGASEAEIGQLQSGLISSAQINVGQLTGDSAAFKELFTQYLEANVIVAKFLSADEAEIGKLRSELIEAAEINVGQIKGEYGEFENFFATNLDADTITTKLLDADEANIDKVRAELIESAEINVTQIKGQSGEFENFFATNLSADSIATKLLDADEANIKNLQAGLIESAEISVGQIKGESGEFDTFFATNLGADTLTATLIKADEADVEKLQAALVETAQINVGNITGESGEFETFFVNNMNVNNIFGDNADFNTIVADRIDASELNATVGNISNLLSGKAGVGDLTAFNMTADNVTIADAVIKDLIAAKISVADLMTHSATADEIKIISDGKAGIAFKNATQQFYDSDGNVRVQIGQDGTGDFNFVVVGEDGTTALFDSNGITQSGIPDNTIVNDMISNGTISKEKVAFKIETDENGNVVTSIENIYTGEGGKFGAEYTTFKESTNRQLGELSSMVTDVELSGEQVFIESRGAVAPYEITVTAKCRNTAVSKWYLNGIENTEFVASDKLSITIPVTFTDDKKIVVVKVETVDGKTDVHSIYRVTDGNDSYTVVVQSANGTVFRLASGEQKTQTSSATCNVYKGSELVEPKSYTWYYIDGEGSQKVLGTGKTINLSLSSSVIRKQVWCEVDVEDEVQYYTVDDIDEYSASEIRGFMVAEVEGKSNGN